MKELFPVLSRSRGHTHLLSSLKGASRILYSVESAKISLVVSALLSE